VVTGEMYVLTFNQIELAMICSALYQYQAFLRTHNLKEAELAGALRQVLNKATVQVYWEAERAMAVGDQVPLSP
jgi:hypothetical protein